MPVVGVQWSSEPKMLDHIVLKPPSTSDYAAMASMGWRCSFYQSPLLHMQLMIIFLKCLRPGDVLKM